MSLCAFVCICATVRCSLVTNWLGMRADWCVGVKMMSVNVPSLMVIDVDVDVDDLTLRLCCIHIINYICVVLLICNLVVLVLVDVFGCPVLPMWLFVCVSLSLMSSSLVRVWFNCQTANTECVTVHFALSLSLSLSPFLLFFSSISLSFFLSLSSSLLLSLVSLLLIMECQRMGEKIACECDCYVRGLSLSFL